MCKIAAHATAPVPVAGKGVCIYKKVRNAPKLHQSTVLQNEPQAPDQRRHPTQHCNGRQQRTDAGVIVVFDYSLLRDSSVNVRKAKLGCVETDRVIEGWEAVIAGLNEGDIGTLLSFLFSLPLASSQFPFTRTITGKEARTGPFPESPLGWGLGGREEENSNLQQTTTLRGSPAPRSGLSHYPPP